MIENLDTLTDFLDDMPIGITRTNITSNQPKHFNKHFLQMYGWDRSDIDSTEKWFKHAFPDDTYRSLIWEHRDQAAHDTESQNSSQAKRVVIKVACKDGNYKWCEVRYFRKKEYLYGIYSDVTEQKTTQNRLQETLEETRALELRKELALRAGTIGIWEWDYATNQLTWDNTMYQIYGIDPGVKNDSPYTMWSNAVDPDEKPVVEEILFRAKEQNREYNAKFWITTPEGVRKYIHAIGRNEFDADGKAIRMVGINTDITEHKVLLDDLGERVQHELDERIKSIKLFKDVIDSTTNTVALLDKEYRFRIVNNAFKTLHNKRHEEVLGKTPPEAGVMPEEFFNSNIKPALTKVLAGESLHFRTWLDNKKQKVYLSIQMIPHRSSDEVEGIIIITTDITQVYQLEQDYFNNQKKAAMGELIGIIAHQLKQPLNAISLTASLISDDYAYGELTDKQIEKYENSLLENVNFMANSIDELRNFFRPDKTPKPCSVTHAIEKALSIVSANIRSKGIAIVTDFQEDASFYGIENELQQVILNIVTNAKDVLVEKHPANPFIKITTSTINHQACIQIEDNGGGIAEEHMGKIFDSYYTTKGEQGTGIGLNLSKMIVENSMHGKISAENVNNGARFTITLPLANA